MDETLKTGTLEMSSFVVNGDEGCELLNKCQPTCPQELQQGLTPVSSRIEMITIIDLRSFSALALCTRL